MTLTRMRTAVAIVVAVLVAVVTGLIEYSRTGSWSEGGEAFAAGLIGVAVIAIAVTLPGLSGKGLAFGGLFTLAGLLTWTSTERPIVIWGVLAIEVVVFALWAWPWIRSLRSLGWLGTAWLGLAYWFLGIAGAVLVAHWKVGAQRVAYAAVFTLAVLAIIALTARRGERDLSIGMAAGVLLGIAALLLFGAGSLFDDVHAIPDNSVSARMMTNRFWGGPGLYYHPNSLAGLMVIAAIRVGLDSAMAAWQRLGVAALSALVLSISDSRTGFVFAAGAALVNVVVVLRRRSESSTRARWIAVGTPFVVLAIVVTLGGGYQFLLRDRFTDNPNDVTSGRTDTWRQVWTDWKGDGWAEKTFGNADTSRAVVTRLDDGNPIEGPRRQLNTDNAFVGAFRRGGVLGALTFVLGLALLLWHALRRRPAAWFVIAALAVVPTIATEDWLIGGTNGAIWLVLTAGEARARLRADGDGDGAVGLRVPRGRDVEGAAVGRVDA